MIKALLSLAVLLSPVPALAQTPARSAATADVDPARLKAARGVVDQLFPPATRVQMMQAMIDPVTANIRQSMTQNPQFAEALGKNPRIKPLLDQFMERQTARSNIALREALPAMSEAMARAYARRFDLAQLRDLSVFFATPTGQVYMRESMSMMSDPDIAAWQQSLMTKSLSHLQDDVAEFSRQLLTLEKPEGQK